MHVAGHEVYAQATIASALTGVSGNITYTAWIFGEEGNITITYTYDADVTATEAEAEYTSATTLVVRVNGAVTLGTAVAAINDAEYDGVQLITASVASGNSGNSLTWTSASSDQTVNLVSGAGDARDLLDGTVIGTLPTFNESGTTYRCRLYARSYGNSSGNPVAAGVAMTHTLKVDTRTIFEDASVPRQFAAGTASQPGIQFAFPFEGQDLPIDEFTATSGQQIVLDVTPSAAGQYHYRFEATPLSDIIR